MREKLVFILRNPLLTLDDRTDQILSLLIEEIKKELLTDEEIRESAVKVRGLYYTGGIGYQDTLTEFGKDAVQAQLQKILKALEEK